MKIFVRAIANLYTSMASIVHLRQYYLLPVDNARGGSYTRKAYDACLCASEESCRRDLGALNNRSRLSGSFVVVDKLNILAM